MSIDLEYIIYSRVPSATIFILSAIVSIHVSDSLVWMCINCILPIFSYTLDSLLAEDNDYIDISNISTKLNCWNINLFSLCYCFGLNSWRLIPMHFIYNHLCDNVNKNDICTKVSLGLAVLKLSYKIWIATPLAYLGWTKYEERKTVAIDSYEYKKLTWEIYAFATAILIFASYYI